MILSSINTLIVNILYKYQIPRLRCFKFKLLVNIYLVHQYNIIENFNLLLIIIISTAKNTYTMVKK